MPIGYKFQILSQDEGVSGGVRGVHRRIHHVPFLEERNPIRIVVANRALFHYRPTVPSPLKSTTDVDLHLNTRSLLSISLLQLVPFFPGTIFIALLPWHYLIIKYIRCPFLLFEFLVSHFLRRVIFSATNLTFLAHLYFRFGKVLLFVH